ncbi:hypothetical protein J1N35_032717 [Gossypium stocksii]|uniref:Uncharacterized protein n=1 Tax=Gossypium stocksii TaxID=47602 RepID=A0A9D3V481_9ROSI|nr:hypothetical protein J1N35_032717 [Gossypium stocksii]
MAHECAISSVHYHGDARVGLSIAREFDEHWPTFHVQYINIWNNRYEFLPTCETIVTLELDYNLEYMPWFRVHDKPYLLAEEVRGRQLPLDI